MNRFSALGVALCLVTCTLDVFSQQGSQRHVLTIGEMFSLVDSNCISLRPARTGVEEAGEGLREARRSRLPDIQASLSFLYIGNGWMSDRDFSNGTKAEMPHYGNNFSVEATQVIYAGGVIRRGIALAELARENAELEAIKQRKDLYFQFVGDYLELFQQRNLLGVYESHIEQTAKVLQEMKAKEGQGLVLPNDITRYELLLKNLELQRTRIRNTVEILNTDLVTRLGMAPGTVILPDTTLLTRVLPEKDKDEWLQTATRQSVSLQQLTLGEKMSRQEEGIARSERLPQVALVASNHFDGPILIEVPPIDKNFNYWYVGVGIKYNLASLYKKKSSVQKQRLATRRVQEQYADAAEQTRLLVNAEYIRYREEREQLQTRLKNVELARQNHEVVRHRYYNELALVTDLLDADNARLQADVELANSRVSIIFSYYKLLYLAGII